jgi:RNA polymerase sigma-70 factor (ECF subfamily)
MDPTPNSLDDLLEKLSQGDREAAEQVFLASESCLRRMVRRMLPASLQSKFDSVDVLQSVWADLWKAQREGRSHFEYTSQLKAFLVTATRNRFIDRLRQHHVALQCQRALDVIPPDQAPASNADTPSEEAMAHELWDRLMHLCPPQHRRLIHLRREGHSLAEIAAQTGLHPSSLRRIFYEMARRLAEGS